MNTLRRGRPPDGGWGWVVVAACFLLLMLELGTVCSLSVLYVSWLEEFHALKGTTSWIVSVAAGLAYSFAPFPAGVARRFGYRVVTLIGAFLCSIGFFLSYFATSVYFLMITIGVISGIGSSFCYLPAVTMVGIYFCKRRALAMSIATSGVAVGVFILPPFINWLVEEFTWRGSILILSGLGLNGIVCGSVLLPVEQFTIFETQDNECQSMLGGEEKSDLEGGEELTANEPVGSTPADGCKGKACDTKPGPDLAKQSHETNLISNEYALMEPVNRLSYSENNFDKTVNARTCLDCEHLRIKPNVGGSLKVLSSFTEESPHVREFSSERHINISKNSGKSTNLTTNRIPNFGKAVGSSFHSLLFVDRKFDSVVSLHSEHNDKTDEHEEEEDTMTRKLCSQFARAFRSYVHLLRNVVFLLLGISNFLSNLSALMPVLYMVDRAVENNISKSSAAVMLSIYGAGSLVVRLVMGLVADSPCMDTFVCYISSLMICGISTCLSALCGESLVLHSIYSFIYGGFMGGYSSLVPVVTAELVDAQYIGIAISTILAFTGPATVIGLPLAGWLVDWTGSYNFSFIINGICLFLSGAMLLPVLWLQRQNVRRVHLDDV